MVGQVERGGLPQRDGPGGGEKLRHKLGAEIAVFPVEGEAQQAERHPDIAVAVVRPAGGHGPQTGLRQPVGPVGHRDPVAAAGGDAAAAELVGGLLREAAEGEAVKPSVALQADGGVGEPRPLSRASRREKRPGYLVSSTRRYFTGQTSFLAYPARRLLPYHTGGRPASLCGWTGGKPLQNKDPRAGGGGEATQPSPRRRAGGGGGGGDNTPPRRRGWGKKEKPSPGGPPPPGGKRGGPPGGIPPQGPSSLSRRSAGGGGVSHS